MRLVSDDTNGKSSLNSTALPTAPCNCQALRQAARRVTALYDAELAPFGLRVSQFSVLVRLHRGGPRSIRALAAELEMDRTTLGRNIRPLERDGLLHAGADPVDGRSRLLAITPHGLATLQRATPAWRQAQATFEACYGSEAAAGLRAALLGVVAALHPTRIDVERPKP